MKHLIRFALLLVFAIVLLAFGGYSLSSFGTAIHLKDPTNSIDKVVDILPNIGDLLDVPASQDNLDNVIAENQEKDAELRDRVDNANSSNNKDADLLFDPDALYPSGEAKPTSSSSDNFDDLFANVPWKDQMDNSSTSSSSSSSSDGIDYNDLNSISVAFASTYKIKINDKEIEFGVERTLDFVKWLHKNFTEDSDISIELVETQPEDTVTPTETEEIIPTEAPTPTEEPIDDTGVKYNRVLNTVRDLTPLVESIPVVTKLDKGSDYDRNLFEKPVKSYYYQYKDATTGELVITSQKMQRNDYAWMTSKYLESLVPLKYICPYTGTVIIDGQDGKEDGDMGNLDYDHLVPLKSAYIRGAKNWSDEKKNAYAYDQWVGVDVLNSANRSKSDKGPLDYLPDINKEDYCYSWLLICSKYQLAMTQEEIDLCVNIIKEAVLNGETVEHMGGSYVEK